jgi:hypothetical protein
VGDWRKAKKSEENVRIGGDLRKKILEKMRQFLVIISFIKLILLKIRVRNVKFQI